jgi:hypothetical protein
MSEGKVYRIKIIGQNEEDVLEMTLTNEASNQDWKDIFKVISKWAESH